MLDVGVGDGDVGICLEQLHRLFQHGGPDDVVGVERQHVGAAGHADAGVACLGHSAVGRLQQADRASGMLGDDRVGRSGCVIRAAVVDDDELPVGECLGDDAFDRVPQKLGLLVARHDHRHQRRRRGGMGERQFDVLMAAGGDEPVES